MNVFPSNLDITVRQMSVPHTPVTNTDSQLDREQTARGEYYYV